VRNAAQIFDADGEPVESEESEEEETPVDPKAFDTVAFNIDDEEEHVVRFDPKKGEKPDPTLPRASNVARNCVIPA